MTKYKTINASDYFTTKTDEGEDCILINTLEGLALRIVKKEPNIIPLSEGLSCDPNHPTTFDKEKIRRRFDRTQDGSDFYAMNVYCMHDFKRFYKKTWPKNSKRSQSGPQKHGIGF